MRWPWLSKDQYDVDGDDADDDEDDEGEHRRKIWQYLGSLCTSVNFSNDIE